LEFALLRERGFIFEDSALLGREPVIAYGASARELIAGRRVLVTGAGGSIGSELVRQLHALCPEMLYLLDHDESSMHAVQLELYGDGQMAHERTILADIRDRDRLVRLFDDARPDLIFHAAAHKHLSILERYPSEAVRTNILGTDNIVRAAQECGAERLTFISTDKAANPTSVLGASKRVGEVLTHRGATRQLRTASVRFGNVLGSRGSFLHTLAHQLQNNMPVTITHPDADRFFMSIPEAAALVVEASVSAHRGETYVLDMGEPVKILELVERFVEINHLPSPEIRITGMAPGEKLSESLIDEREVCLNTKHPRIWQVPSTESRQLTLDRLEYLYALAMTGNEDDVRSELWNAAEVPYTMAMAFGASALAR
jgi:FlaA1/EpsC-like NDP-sugar epimerase